MFKYAILALLLVATLQSSYYISPIYPPTAFEGQFYEVRFRVRGLDYPTFSFKGLPENFHGSSDGVVSGIARGSGSYSVVISFGSGSERGTKQIVLRVTPALQSSSTFQSAIVISAEKLYIGYPKNLVYTVGGSIQLALEAHHGVSPLLWRYINLPTGLYGDQSGIIRGSLADSGYYSFNVECSDSVGISTQAYLTLNIQPKSTVRTTQVVQVQNQHVPLIYDIEQVESQQVQADNQLFDVLDFVDKNKAIVNSLKRVVAVATLAVTKATASLQTATKEYNVALSTRNNAQDRLRIAESALKAAQENLNLAIIQQGNAQKNVASVQRAVSEAQNRFAQAQKDLSIAEDKLVAAQQDMKNCEQNLRTAKTAREAADSEYSKAFYDLEDAKQDLEVAKRRKEIADLAVSDAKDTLDIIQQVRDDSIAALNIAEFALKQAEINLAKILDKLAYIRSLYEDAKINFGEAKWNYEQALNKLYVAQARKQTADRASAIALAEGSRSDHNSDSSSSSGSVSIGSSTSTFIGCESNNYPPISGTVKITQKMSHGYTVSTGHEIVYGSCTNKVDCNIGDTIAYNGFIVNGVINAKRIERVLLS